MKRRRERIEEKQREGKEGMTYTESEEDVGEHACPAYNDPLRRGRFVHTCCYTERHIYHVIKEDQKKEKIKEVKEKIS